MRSITLTFLVAMISTYSVQVPCNGEIIKEGFFTYSDTSEEAENIEFYIDSESSFTLRLTSDWKYDLGITPSAKTKNVYFELEEILPVLDRVRAKRLLLIKVGLNTSFDSVRARDAIRQLSEKGWFEIIFLQRHNSGIQILAHFSKFEEILDKASTEKMAAIVPEPNTVKGATKNSSKAGDKEISQDEETD